MRERLDHGLNLVKFFFFAKLTKRLLGGARINFNVGQGVVGKGTRGPNCIVIFITSEEFRLWVDFTKVRAVVLEHLSLSSLSRSRPYTPPPSGIQPSFRKDPLHSSFHRSVFASPSTHIDVARRDVPDWRFRWGEGGGLARERRVVPGRRMVGWIRSPCRSNALVRLSVSRYVFYYLTSYQAKMIPITHSILILVVSSSYCLLLYNSIGWIIVSPYYDTMKILFKIRWIENSMNKLTQIFKNVT